jgi:NitT/TauT family transport system substrate-binding protein
MGAIWPEHELSLRLEQSLILAMEDQARWMIANNLTTPATMPNFLNNIYAWGLEAVAPEAVDIIF